MAELEFKTDVGGSGGVSSVALFTKNFVTLPLVYGAIFNTRFSLGRTYAIERLSANFKCRARFYNSAAAREDDKFRWIGQHPTDAEGCLMDIIINPSDSDTAYVNLSPVLYANDGTTYVSVMNLDSDNEGIWMSLVYNRLVQS